jgi:hypothetical protein
LTTEWTWEPWPSVFVAPDRVVEALVGPEPASVLHQALQEVVFEAREGHLAILPADDPAVLVEVELRLLRYGGTRRRHRDHDDRWLHCPDPGSCHGRREYDGTGRRRDRGEVEERAGLVRARHQQQRVRLTEQPADCTRSAVDVATPMTNEESGDLSMPSRGLWPVGCDDVSLN